MPKTDLFLEKPLMNGAGTLGFSPDTNEFPFINHFGAFVTNPISWTARTPAKGTRYIPFSGGFLLHTGYPNPGINTVVRVHARRWARSPLPVIAHILAQDAHTVARMVQKLEDLEGLIAVEIGLPPGIDPTLVYELTLAATGELAVIVRLPFELGTLPGSNESLLDAVNQAGANAISLAPPRGQLPDRQGTNVAGRLYGPSIFPQAFSILKRLAGSNLPIIISGGIYKPTDIDTMLVGGATAIQLDAVLWRGINDLGLIG